jgi:MFS family permease
MKNFSFAAMAPLFLVLMIDSMGLGILFPILSSMIIDPSSTFLTATTSNLTREFIYGAIIGIYMIAWFFGSAILGDLSDIIGRKKSLLVCLLGACFGYLLAGISFYMHSIMLLIIGRIIAGFTAGSQPIAQAAIIDVSEPEHKARNLGFILLAVSIGFIFGPLAGGFLSDSNFGSWCNYATPMFFAAFLSVFNAGLLWKYFKETFIQTRQVKIRPQLAIEIFIDAFKHPKICWLSLVLLIFISGWGEYFGFISQFLLRRYQYSSLETSLFMVFVAGGFGLGFGFLVDICANRFNLKHCVSINLAIAAILCLITATSHAAWITWVCALPIGITISIAYSILITLFSNQVNENEQGWVMGVTNAIMALSFGVTTFLSGFAAHLNEGFPILWAFLGMLIAAAILWRLTV